MPASHLSLALDLDHSHAHARNHDVDLVPALNLTRSLARDLNRNHDLDLDLLRNLALARGSSHIAPQELVRITAGLGRLVDTVLADALQEAMTRARRISATLARTDTRLAATVNTADADDVQRAVQVLEAALSDAIDADLSTTDLDDVPLEGVLWSSGTRWPPHLADQVRETSEQIAPDRFRIVGSPPRQVGHHATT